MSSEFAAGRKQSQAAELLARLAEEGSGAISIQVLAEFYAAATRTLGILSREAADIGRRSELLDHTPAQPRRPYSIRRAASQIQNFR